MKAESAIAFAFKPQADPLIEREQLGWLWALESRAMTPSQPPPLPSGGGRGFSTSFRWRERRKLLRAEKEEAQPVRKPHAIFNQLESLFFFSSFVGEAKPRQPAEGDFSARVCMREGEAS